MGNCAGANSTQQGAWKHSVKKIPALAIKICLNYFLFDLRADDNFSVSFMINYSDNPGIKTNGEARVNLTACSEPLGAHLKAGLGTLPSQP